GIQPRSRTVDKPDNPPPARLRRLHPGTLGPADLMGAETPRDASAGQTGVFSCEAASAEPPARRPGSGYWGRSAAPIPRRGGAGAAEPTVSVGPVKLGPPAAT